MALKNKRWIHLAAGIIAELCIGIGYAWSVFQNPLVDKFGWTTSAVSVAFTITTVMGAMAPLVGKLQEYVKTRTIVLMGACVYGSSLVATGFIDSITTLYIFYGFGVGLGTSMVYPLVISYMVNLFPEKRGLISGLMVSSYGSGAILWAPVGAWLTATFGVLNAFKFLGIGLFILIAIASRFIGDIRDDHDTAGTGAQAAFDKPNGKTWREMLNTPIFYVIFLAITIGATSGLMILGHASPIVQSTMKIPAQKAAFIVGILATSNALGRLLWGGISDSVGRYPILILLFILSAVSFFALQTSSLTAVFLAAVIMIELCYGGYIALIAPITADIFGTRQLSINYGIMFIAFSFGGIIGPRLAAIVKEANNGSYHEAYGIAMAMCLAGLLLAVLAAVNHHRISCRKSDDAVAV